MSDLRRLSSAQPDFSAQLAALTAIEATQDADVENVVREILADVRKSGDQAVLRHTAQFDRMSDGLWAPWFGKLTFC